MRRRHNFDAGALQIKEMGVRGTKQFLQSAVAAGLVQIEQHLLAELPVSLRVNETVVSDISDICRFNQREFIIVSSASQTF